MRNKVYKYAVFFFPDGKKIGTAPTSNILDGYKTNIKQGEIVSLNWEGSPVLGKIIFLHGKYRVTRLEKFTGCARKLRNRKISMALHCYFCISKKG